MSATNPFKLPAGRVAHASAVDVDVPVRFRGLLPDCGGCTPSEDSYPTGSVSGVIVKYGSRFSRLSKEATPMTFVPFAGAPELYSPTDAAFPTAATTTMPLSTNR